MTHLSIGPLRHPADYEQDQYEDDENDNTEDEEEQWQREEEQEDDDGIHPDYREGI